MRARCAKQSKIVSLWKRAFICIVGLLIIGSGIGLLIMSTLSINSSLAFTVLGALGSACTYISFSGRSGAIDGMTEVIFDLIFDNLDLIIEGVAEMLS